MAGSLEAPRPQAAGAGSRPGHRPRVAPPRRDRGRAHRGRVGRAGGPHPAIKARGVAMIWIEHVVHALLAVADRLVVMNSGATLAEGEPAEVMADRGSAADLSGHRGMSRLLATAGLTAFYGDFQALFGIDFEVGRARWWRSSAPTAPANRRFCEPSAGCCPSTPGEVRLDGEPIGGLPAHRIAARGLAMVPEGRRLFRSLSVEENLLAGAYLRRARPLEPGPRLRALSGAAARSGGPTRARYRAASSRWRPSAGR